MDISIASAIGFAAGICTTLSFFPQVLKTVRSRRTQDLSLSMYAILSVGLFLWISYGVLIRDIPVLFANGVSFVLAVTVLIYKIKYG